MSSIRSTPRERGIQAREESGEQARPARRSRRWAPLAVVLTGLIVVTTGCTSNAFTRQGFLPPVTKQGQVILSMWQGSWIAAWAVGIVVWGGILWAVIFHRKRGNQLPQQVRYNLPIEILYTMLPFIMVGVLFYFTARDENFIDKIPAHPQVVVNVTGFQWSWQFQYPQFKVPGKTGADSVVTETGTMWDPTASIQHLPLLEIPAHETVKFNLTSIDVVHAFWVVPFEFKRDVIPGYANHFAVTAIKTGSFIGRCTELCGIYHSRMLFKIKIVSPAKFRQWIAGQQAAQSSGGVQ
ncbi:MAG TPA: cytochrome c oxidase subunit II [Streptosporangiaceae bacterium]|nr:cytochrome c oxidase subunit II [Streptosporangiaceae bacterium]